MWKPTEGGLARQWKLSRLEWRFWRPDFLIMNASKSIYHWVTGGQLVFLSEPQFYHLWMEMTIHHSECGHLEQ